MILFFVHNHKEYPYRVLYGLQLSIINRFKDAYISMPQLCNN